MRLRERRMKTAAMVSPFLLSARDVHRISRGAGAPPSPTKGGQPEGESLLALGH
jgi:hypothetical protein